MRESSIGDPPSTALAGMDGSGANPVVIPLFNRYARNYDVSGALQGMIALSSGGIFVNWTRNGARHLKR
jgi:hypothetical protein